jgi:hypothetical protein
MKSYLDKQRQFWNVDPITSKFVRVDTVSADKVENDRLAETHFEQICSGVELRDSSTIFRDWLRGRTATFKNAAASPRAADWR